LEEKEKEEKEEKEKNFSSNRLLFAEQALPAA
jgi:hypothetical protein